MTRWFILRTGSGQTLALAASLRETGFEAWTPGRTLRRSMPAKTESGKRIVETEVPILPTFVFVQDEAFAAIAEIAVEQTGEHSPFSIFRQGGRVPLIGDREVAGLREEEARQAAVIKAIHEAESHAEAEAIRIAEIKHEAARRRAQRVLEHKRREALRIERGPIAPDTEVEVIDAPALVGTAVLRNDGFAYQTVADTTLGATGGSVAVKAVAPGVAGNAVVGTAFTLASAQSGVAALGSADGPITGGADVESDDGLRARMLAAYAAPPQGGAISDYRQWALAVPSVTRCWVTPGGMGPGTVVIYFMMDAAQAAFGGFPQGSSGVAAAEYRDAVAAGDQLAVANAIFPLQPATPIVYVVAPQANVLAFTIAGLPNASATLKAAVAAAIDGALYRGGQPGGVTNISAIEAAIAAVNGTAGFVITAITASAGAVTPGPIGNIVSSAGRLPQRGAITWA